MLNNIFEIYFTGDYQKIYTNAFFTVVNYPFDITMNDAAFNEMRIYKDHGYVVQIDFMYGTDFFEKINPLIGLAPMRRINTNIDHRPYFIELYRMRNMYGNLFVRFLVPEYTKLRILEARKQARGPRSESFGKVRTTRSNEAYINDLLGAAKKKKSKKK